MRIVTLGLLLLMAQDRREVLADLESFDQQIATLSTQVDALETRTATLEAERQANAAALAEAEAAVAARRSATAGRLHTFYRLKRRGFARLLFDAEDPSELRRRVRYLVSVLRADEADTRAYTARLAEKKAAAARVEADAAALAGVQADLRTRLEALQAERARRRALVRDIQARPEVAAMLVQERGVAAAALSQSIAVTESTAPAAPGDAAAFRADKGRLPSPVAGSLARGFGPYTDPASGLPADNLGVDFDAPLGAPFRAVAAGVVTRSGYVRGYGQVVMVQHGPYTTLYAHANGLRVAQGQAVERGDVLGLVGNTGLGEDADARLHFEVRYNNTPQDPAEWLAR